VIWIRTLKVHQNQKEGNKMTHYNRNREVGKMLDAGIENAMKLLKETISIMSRKKGRAHENRNQI
jgi:hypothetical protein